MLRLNRGGCYTVCNGGYLFETHQNQSSVFLFWCEFNHDLNEIYNCEHDDTCVVNTALIDSPVEGENLASC